MSLPACQERILSGIEDTLRKGEPRLASRFAIFSRLTRGEELPRTEQLMPQPWLRRALASAGRAWRFLFPRPALASTRRSQGWGMTCSVRGSASPRVSRLKIANLEARRGSAALSAFLSR